MSLLESLKPKKGSVKNRKRIGRGDASGQGGTAGKGHKGQKARAGGAIKRGFEGGQTPLTRRIPKFGFTNKMFKTTYEIVNIDALNKFDGEVTPEILQKSGLVGKGRVKILGRGQLEKSLTVHAHKISRSAQEQIEKAGGSIQIVSK